MDPTRTVCATEQTWMWDGWTNGQTECNQYTPQQLRWAGGIMSDKHHEGEENRHHNSKNFWNQLTHSKEKQYLYVRPGSKQPSGESFLLRVCSLLCWVCDTNAGNASPFWRTGHGWVVRTFGIVTGGGVALRLWGPCSTLGSSTWAIHS